MIAHPNGNGKPTRARKPAPLDNVQSAIRAHEVARTRELPPPEIIRRLASDWGDALHLAAESGQEGIDQWLVLMRARLRDDAPRYEALVKALDDARGMEPGAEGEEQPPKRRSFRDAICGSAAFAAKKFVRQWGIKGVFVLGQPTIIGGSRKALKTTLMIEAAISLGSATRFLGEFEVPQTRKVLFLSGESGDPTVQETANRICLARGLELDELEGQVFWGPELPQLHSAEDMVELTEFIKENGIEVVIIDPLYLCLISGSAGRVDPANLFEVGPLMKRVSDTCLEAGATPLFVHHLRKNRESPDSPPELEDLAYAGVQEFARQWVLIGRREDFEPGSGDHKLWLNVGGSAGHSGCWGIDVSEGVIDDEFQGRTWSVSINRANEARSEAKAIQQAAKAEEKARQLKAKDEAKATQEQTDAEKVQVALLGADGPMTKEDLRGATGLRSGFSRALHIVVHEWKVAEKVEFQKRCGKGDRPVEGYQRIASS